MKPATPPRRTEAGADVPSQSQSQSQSQPQPQPQPQPDEIIGLFPTPLLRAPATLPRPLVERLAQHFGALASTPNDSSPDLSHSRMLNPAQSPLLVEVAALLGPRLVDFGALMFGERMGWSVKEMWVNVLETHGRQAMHNHANSFASGVIYLSAVHDSARTVFMKSPGGTDFVFRNDHARTTAGPFSADKWISPAPQPGDALLFPSYLMHAVPPNAGGRRVTLAFNAIPARLDSWGYGIGFRG